MRLAPPPRPVAAVPAARARDPDHRRLRAARRTTACCTSSGSCSGPTPGILAATAGSILLFAAGHHVLPARAAAHGLRDLVVGAPLHLPRAVPLVLAPDRHGRVVRRPSGRALLVDAAVARDARGRRRRRGSGCRSGARCATRCASSASAPRARASCRSCCAAAGSTGSRSRAGSSSSGASCAAACGGRRTRTRSRPRRRATCCGSRSRTSATTAPAWPRSRPARASRSRARTAPSPPTRAERDRLLLIGAGVGTAPVLALLQELPAGSDVTVLLRASTRGDLVLRDEVAREVRAPRRPARRARRPARPRAARRRGADAGSCPTCAAARSTCAGPTPLSRRLAAELERAGVPGGRIHFESFTF